MMTKEIRQFTPDELNAMERGEWKMMTKQDIIREGIKEWVLEIRQYLCNTEFAPKPFTKPVDPSVLTEGFPQKLIKFLGDDGVMIKVKCPDCEWGQFGEEVVGMTPCYSCNSTGYIIEPLVE